MDFEETTVLYEVKDNQGDVPDRDPSMDNMTDDELKQAIMAEQAKLSASGLGLGQQAVQGPQPTETGKTPSQPVDEGQVKQDPQAAEQVAEPTKAEPPEGEPQQQAKVEPQPERVENFMHKKGFKSIDEIVKTYENLEKKMHQQGQEISQYRRQEVQQPVQQQQQQIPVPQPSQNEINEWFQRTYEVDPVGALYAVNQLFNKPIFESQRDQVFKNELTRLSNSPQTLDFNLEPVQQEMQKVIEARPDKYRDRYGKIDPDKLEDIYWIAKGRTAKSNVTVGSPPQHQVNKTSPVEGASKPEVPKRGFDPNTATDDELVAEIKRLQGTLF